MVSPTIIENTHTHTHTYIQRKPVLSLLMPMSTFSVLQVWLLLSCGSLWRHTQREAGGKRWSAAWAAAVMQRSLGSRCDTLTVARCEERGGRGGQPALFLQTLSKLSQRSGGLQRCNADRLTYVRAYHILAPPLRWNKDYEIKIEERLRRVITWGRRCCVKRKRSFERLSRQVQTFI